VVLAPAYLRGTKGVMPFPVLSPSTVPRTQLNHIPYQEGLQ
jgi:hypothetical protein